MITLNNNEYIKIIDRYANMLYKTAFSYCLRQQDSEDVIQNVFMKLVMGKQKFADEEHIKRWLLRVTINECKNLLGTYWRKNVASLDEMDIEIPGSEREEHSDLFYALQKLPQKYRVVVHLYYYEDYSVKEISEILQRKETTIQTQLMRARQMLKLLLKEEWDDELNRSI